MSENDICCQTLRRSGPSPFEIFMLGWYDGLTSGIARCRTCDRTYHVEMVAWDDEHEVRVYGFREVSRQSYDAFMELQMLPTPSADEAMARSNAIALRVRDALATSFERVLYVAAVDLAKEIKVTRVLTFASWSSLLEL